MRVSEAASRAGGERRRCEKFAREMPGAVVSRRSLAQRVPSLDAVGADVSTAAPCNQLPECVAASASARSPYQGGARSCCGPHRQAGRGTTSAGQGSTLKRLHWATASNHGCVCSIVC